MRLIEKIQISISQCSTLIPHSRNLHISKITTDRFNKILIANRGEIACRVTRTAKKLGVKTVAVYSDIDKDSLHVEQADEAYCIGPAPSSQSYLRQDKIISIAKKSKSQAIHPGYGFLSENAEFAELCQKENIVFVGPPADAIKNMGIKSTSKDMMIKAGIPVIAGYHGDNQSNETLLLEAKKIGFPLMIKAVCGGGGKGMRIVLKESQFIEALESAKTESKKAFGDSSILLEQYVRNPRHIEVQIFADKHGNVVHMFERDCSIQRRHQKIIEEAPAPGISINLRSDLGATAVRAAKAVGYVGAGTVEFIMDRDQNNFYFMEMNTRLQVEHPITEAITGLDLVEWQLRIAAGEELPLKQAQINFRGHAFEARIYAEEPRKDFLPGAGKLSYMRVPEIATEAIRIETGVREKDQVSVHYDPMIAKLIVWGKDRKEALAILRSKLNDYNIAGLSTNIEFIKDLCSHSNFLQGQVHTGFIEEHCRELFRELHVPSEVVAQAALASILYEDTHSLRSSLTTVDPFSPFATEIGLRLNHTLTRTLYFNVCDDDIEVEIRYIEPEVYSMRINQIGPWRRVTGTLKKKENTLELCTEIDETITRTKIIKIHNKLHLFTKDREWQFNIPPRKFLYNLTKCQNKVDPCKALSPIPGSVEKVCVAKGDTVKIGDALLVINAMKMEHIIRASVNGLVEDVLCSIGDNVPKDKILVKLTKSVS
ncbi:methylcrotonoyl-CoA carboxylase subunit alpha, mitochondrial isoform X1 [Bombus impatiens]|uniref:Methylcrotonoyl-CoA carboxylase subunit alpha, mitochondrial isoform X1 n=1 Tax=Bombus impatiens TaxID=132113 RepID=A0A6P6FDG6_BOMIM|nr:methylcrotonoyl-CoA carboxylase subunit alpha, mitochondrial isoform X1 [Bombus impatiens]XP_024225105.1 methylcrotonoyl-CoA carboxylase subunit alpha, mitochondrial isoform X1 [Bombus impatiens]